MENKKRLVFLTGAGISKESGIPTFRDSIDGLWENYRVEEVATGKAIKEHPDIVYEFINGLRNKYKGCKPNYAHEAIAELEDKYDVTVITQNIDIFMNKLDLLMLFTYMEILVKLELWIMKTYTMIIQKKELHQLQK